MVNPTGSPVVFVFDLDETLFSIELEKGDREGKLSQSTKNQLSKSNRGVMKEPPLVLTPEGEELKADSLIAISRETIKKIFNEINDTVQKARSLEKKPPIAIKIITTATYDEKYVKRVLDHLYFNDEKILEDNKLPIEYYNKNNLTRGSEITNPEGVLTNEGTIDTRKVILMEEKFPQWQKDMPGLEKKRVVLVDNADYNTEAVKYHGFSALHYATTPQDRLRNISYTQTGPETVKQIENYINEAKASL